MRAAHPLTLTHLVAHTPYLAVARWCVSPYQSCDLRGRNHPSRQRIGNWL